MTATAATASRKLASGPSTWRRRANVRRTRKLDRESRPTNCSNTFRWYRAGWGRYSQADPVGLGGGTNLFSYTPGNPLRYADPFGLTVWNCSIAMAEASSPIGPGAMLVGIECESECKGNKGLRVYLLGTAVGLSGGTPGSFSFFKATVDDGNDKPTASALGGKFVYGSAGGALGFGGSYSQNNRVSRRGTRGGGGRGGLGGGLDIYGGAVAVISSKEFPCCEKK
jgi:RHS repeat-associated protein